MDFIQKWNIAITSDLDAIMTSKAIIPSHQPASSKADAAAPDPQVAVMPPPVPGMVLAAPQPVVLPIGKTASDAAPKAPDQNPVANQIPDAVGPARPRQRHYIILASFVLGVVVPMILASYYLFAIAKDQYTSSVGFSVRSENLQDKLGILGGLSSLSGTSSSDTDVLYEFIQSQDLVQSIDKRINLRAIYSKPDFDPYYEFDETGSIEDLVDYWQSMVKIFYDRGTGLIELRVHAFDPVDAQRIAQEIYDQSSAMINNLSAIGRDDSTRYAKEDLSRAMEEVKAARTALTTFRSRNLIADPSANVQGQMGLLNSLQQQLTEAMIELNLLRASAKAETDPRVQEMERRIRVIEDLIERERNKFGAGSEGDLIGQGQADSTNEGGKYSALLGQFEALNVDREFAEAAYLTARGGYDAALATAQRQSRYLAAHVRPTLAETPRYPERLLSALLLLGLLLAGWGIVLLVYYSVRDRR